MKPLFKPAVIIVCLFVLAGANLVAQPTTDPGPGAGGPNLLKAPESIMYDGAHQRYLLSNYETGNIIQIDGAGKQSVLVENMVAIQGLEIVGNVVYVGARNSVRGFDLETGKMVMNVPVEGVSNLNDVTADDAGNLYAGDVFGTKIIKIRIRTARIRFLWTATASIIRTVFSSTKRKTGYWFARTVKILPFSRSTWPTHPFALWQIRTSASVMVSSWTNTGDAMSRLGKLFRSIASTRIFRIRPCFSTKTPVVPPIFHTTAFMMRWPFP